MPQAKSPEIRIPKQYASSKHLVAVPESEYRKFTKFTKEKTVKDVLAMVKQAKADYAAGRTRTITSASQLLEL